MVERSGRRLTPIPVNPVPVPVPKSEEESELFPPEPEPESDPVAQFSFDTYDSISQWARAQSPDAYYYPSPDETVSPTWGVDREKQARLPSPHLEPTQLATQLEPTQEDEVVSDTDTEIGNDMGMGQEKQTVYRRKFALRDPRRPSLPRTPSTGGDTQLATQATPTPTSPLPLEPTQEDKVASDTDTEIGNDVIDERMERMGVIDHEKQYRYRNLLSTDPNPPPPPRRRRRPSSSPDDDEEDTAPPHPSNILPRTPSGGDTQLEPTQVANDVIELDRRLEDMGVIDHEKQYRYRNLLSANPNPPPPPPPRRRPSSPPGDTDDEEDTAPTRPPPSSSSSRGTSPNIPRLPSPRTSGGDTQLEPGDTDTEIGNDECMGVIDYEKQYRYRNLLSAYPPPCPCPTPSTLNRSDPCSRSRSRSRSRSLRSDVEIVESSENEEEVPIYPHPHPYPYPPHPRRRRRRRDWVESSQPDESPRPIFPQFPFSEQIHRDENENENEDEDIGMMMV